MSPTIGCTESRNMMIVLTRRAKTTGAIFPYLLLFIFFIAGVLRADWDEEKVKINYLIEEIEQLDGVFIRNGNEHSPAKAANHIRMKMEKAMNSWFAPDKEEWTAEMFIDKIASTSTISGKPYKIKLKTGEIVNAEAWLHQRLKYFPCNP
jgi:hypothetical protein